MEENKRHPCWFLFEGWQNYKKKSRRQAKLTMNAKKVRCLVCKKWIHSRANALKVHVRDYHPIEYDGILDERLEIYLLSKEDNFRQPIPVESRLRDAEKHKRRRRSKAGSQSSELSFESTVNVPIADEQDSSMQLISASSSLRMLKQENENNFQVEQAKERDAVNDKLKNVESKNSDETMSEKINELTVKLELSHHVITYSHFVPKINELEENRYEEEHGTGEEKDDVCVKIEIDNGFYQ
jgi:hypothetical protein